VRRTGNHFYRALATVAATPLVVSASLGSLPVVSLIAGSVKPRFKKRAAAQQGRTEPRLWVHLFEEAIDV
jgi:hypothetical protein